MSEETWAAVEEALRAHVADEEPGVYLTDWLAVSASAIADDSDSTNYQHVRSDSAPHVLLGLAEIAQLRLRTDYVSDTE